MTRIVAALALWLPAVAMAEEPVLSEVFARLSSPDTVQAEVTQTQHRQILGRPLVSTGSLAFARPDKLRWQVDSPARSVFVVQGDRVTTALPDLGRSETLRVGDQPQITALIESLTVWLHADAEQVAAHYDASWQDDHVQLIARDPELSRWIERFELYLQEDGRAVQRVVMHEPDGDRSELVFQSVRLDEPVPDEVFELP